MECKKTSGFEGDELCVEYGLNLYQSGYSGANSPMKFENVRVTKEIMNFVSNSIVDGPFTTWYVTDNFGNVNFCETLILPENFWKIKYRYSTTYPGGSVASSHAPTLSIIFEHDPNNPYESEQEREQRELNERLVKEAEMRLEKQQREQAAIETARLQEKAYQKQIEEEQRRELSHETRFLQQESYIKLENLKNGINAAEESLKQTSPNSTEQREIINKAWDLLKINKQKIDDITERYEKADRLVGSENYENAKSWYTFSEEDTQQVENNLKEISKLIEEAKIEPKFCFLWWCW